MGIQTAAHDQTGLLTASLLILQPLHQTTLELPGDIQQGSADRMILFLELVIHLSDSMNTDVNTAVDISIGNALGSFVQFLQAF